MVLRVAVIGAGAAGLCALRHLAAKPALYEPVGFEQLTGVGGTWIYTDRVGTDENGLPVQSSMYKNLKTNLPKEIMAFPGFPFPENLPSFVQHEDVLKYLEDYSLHYDLRKFIRFGTKVDRVEPLSPGSATEWKISYSSVGIDPPLSDTQLFDVVMVCNGHYAIPLVPDLPGMDQFNGIIMHSHDYREPAPFKDKVVVCLGAGSSGQDIGLDIGTTAKEVILSHNRTPFVSVLPDNVNQQPGIKMLIKDTIIFKNNEEKSVDVLMLCTGYRYNFPFLGEDCSIEIKDERVTPLYKHLIHTKFPSLCMIGICKKTCPFPQFDNQVRFFLSTLDKTTILPSSEEMESDVQKDFEARLKEGLPVRYAHMLGPRQWAYNDMLADMGKFVPNPPVVQILYDEVLRERLKDLSNYKTLNYRVTGYDSYEIVEQ